MKHTKRRHRVFLLFLFRISVKVTENQPIERTSWYKSKTKVNTNRFQTVVSTIWFFRNLNKINKHDLNVGQEQRTTRIREGGREKDIGAGIDSEIGPVDDEVVGWNDGQGTIEYIMTRGVKQDVETARLQQEIQIIKKKRSKKRKLESEIMLTYRRTKKQRQQKIVRIAKKLILKLEKKEWDRKKKALRNRRQQRSTPQNQTLDAEQCANNGSKKTMYRRQNGSTDTERREEKKGQVRL